MAKIVKNCFLNFAFFPYLARTKMANTLPPGDNALLGVYSTKTKHFSEEYHTNFYAYFHTNLNFIFAIYRQFIYRQSILERTYLVQL